MDKDVREMFNMVIEAIDKSEERTNKRFDALEKRMDKMATKEELHNMYELLHHEINGVKLNTEALDMRMECVEKKVDSMDKRLGTVEEKVDSMDKRLGTVEEKVDSMDKRLGTVEEKVDSMDKRLGTVETKVDSMNTTLQSMINHEPRILALENALYGKSKRARRTLWQP